MLDYFIIKLVHRFCAVQEMTEATNLRCNQAVRWTLMWLQFGKSETNWENFWPLQPKIQASTHTGATGKSHPAAFFLINVMKIAWALENTVVQQELNTRCVLSSRLSVVIRWTAFSWHFSKWENNFSSMFDIFSERSNQLAARLTELTFMTDSFTGQPIM